MRKTIDGSRNYFYVLMILACIAGFVVLRDYVTTILLAFITAHMFRPLYLQIMSVTRERKTISLSLTLLVITLIIVIPIILITIFTIAQVNALASDIKDYAGNPTISIDNALDRINSTIESAPYVNYELTEDEIVTTLRDTFEQIAEWMPEFISKAAGNTLEVFAQMIVFVFVLAAAINSYPKIIESFKKLSPLPEEIDDLYLTRMLAMSSSMFRGIFIVASIQGLTAAIILAIAGVDYTVFWGLLAAIAAVLPFGPGAVVIPIGLFVLVTDSLPAGIFIIASSLLIVSTIDNIIRPALASKEAELNEVMTLIGILGGIKLFGFWGIILGPVLLIFFVTTLEVYQKYFRKVNKKFQVERANLKT